MWVTTNGSNTMTSAKSSQREETAVGHLGTAYRGLGGHMDVAELRLRFLELGQAQKMPKRHGLEQGGEEMRGDQKRIAVRR